MTESEDLALGSATDPQLRIASGEERLEYNSDSLQLQSDHLTYIGRSPSVRMGAVYDFYLFRHGGRSHRHRKRWILLTTSKNEYQFHRHGSPIRDFGPCSQSWILGPVEGKQFGRLT